MAASSALKVLIGKTEVEVNGAQFRDRPGGVTHWFSLGWRQDENLSSVGTSDLGDFVRLREALDSTIRFYEDGRKDVRCSSPVEIAPGDHICEGTMVARDASGAVVRSRFALDLSSQAYAGAVKCVDEQGEQDIVSVNDNDGHVAVLSLFDKAIAKLEEEEA